MSLLRTTVLACALAAPAAASTFDFAQWAVDNGEGPFTQMTVDGITVTATTNVNYVHADARPNPAAGLGPCGIADCARSPEDGFGPGETLTLTFSERVNLNGLFLRQSPQQMPHTPDHRPANGTFTLDGAERTVVNGVVAGFLAQGESVTFGHGGVAPSDYYLSAVEVSAVPVPAAGALLAVALGGLAWMRRRRA